MIFRTEAHPLGRPDLSAPVVVSPNATAQERTQAFTEAAEMADKLRLAAGVVGAHAIVFACHAVNESQPDLPFEA